MSDTSEHPTFDGRSWKEIRSYCQSLSAISEQLVFLEKLMFELKGRCVELETKKIGNSNPETFVSNHDILKPLGMGSDGKFRRGGYSFELEELRITIQQVEVMIEYLEKQISKEGSKKEYQSSSIKKIRWRVKTTQLCYLFKLLKQKGFIATDELAKTISDHVLDQNDNPLTSKNLRQVLNNLLDNQSEKPKGADMFEEIIDEMEKI